MVSKFHKSSKISSNAYLLPYKATIISNYFHVYIKTKYYYDYFKLTEVMIDTFLYRVERYNIFLSFLVSLICFYAVGGDSEETRPAGPCGVGGDSEVAGQPFHFGASG